MWSAEETRLEEIAVRYLMNEGGEALIEAIASYKKFINTILLLKLKYPGFPWYFNL